MDISDTLYSVFEGIFFHKKENNAIILQFILWLYVFPVNIIAHFINTNIVVYTYMYIYGR